MPFRYRGRTPQERHTQEGLIGAHLKLLDKAFGRDKGNKVDYRQNKLVH